MGMQVFFNQQYHLPKRPVKVIQLTFDLTAGPQLNLKVMSQSEEGKLKKESLSGVEVVE